MAAPMSKSDYLKKYLSGSDGGEKKKKKRKKPREGPGNKGKGLLIVDEDIGIQAPLSPNQCSGAAAEDDDEETPIVAQVVDERPTEVQLMEEYKQSGRWKALDASLQDRDSDTLPSRRPNDTDPSPSRQQRHDSDTSPPRRQRHDSDASPPRRQRHDSDESPPRRQKESHVSPVRQRHDSDEPTSASRAERHSRPRQPRREDISATSSSQCQVRLDPEASAPCRQRQDSNASPRRRQRHDSDVSPPRRQRHDSDASPPRRKRHDSDASSPRRQRHDSDESPRRRQRPGSAASPLRLPQGSDASPRRRQRHDSDASPPRRQRRDSDASPPRRQKDIYEPAKKGDSHPVSSAFVQQQHQDVKRSASQRRRQDSDESPPRRRSRTSPSGSIADAAKVGKKSTKHELAGSSKELPVANSKEAKSHEGHYLQPSQWSEPGSSEPLPALEKTLDGKKAGLSDARSMRAEADELRRKEGENFRMIGDERLGRNASTILRDSSRHKTKDSVKGAAEKKQIEEKQAQMAEQYSAWGKGLKQAEDRQQRIGDIQHEISKPLARYKDDVDLDAMLRERERAGDPMLAFMRSRKDKGSGGSLAAADKPRYKGPAPPPNRFNIAPGYRWDGVDRSNGFEKQYFTTLNNKKAIEEQAYKWSTEDM